MQRVITVLVDTQQIVKNQTNPFTINEVDGVNEMLEQGWEIERLEILKNGSGDGEMVFLAILNDDPMLDRFDDEFDMEDEDDNEEEDDEDEEDDFDINEIKPMKKV